MKFVSFSLLMMLSSTALFADTDTVVLQKQLQTLQQETRVLEQKLSQLNHSIDKHQRAQPKVIPTTHKKENAKNSTAKKSVVEKPAIHEALVSVHSFDAHPEALEYSPVALVADNHIVTYIAGMPIVSSPYLGERPAYDGSDYIVNISSINRDVRLMEQRRRLYRAYDRYGYPVPTLPIVAISGKVEPLATFGRQFVGPAEGDITLGADELDVAAAINDKVEAYMAIAYDSAPPAWSGQRIANSSFNLNMGFVNIGDLDESPFYFTAGQIFVPFGRFSTSMVSAPLTMLMSRTKARPFILGYKSQKSSGPFAAIYGFSGDTTLGSSAVGGANLGYTFMIPHGAGEIGASFISSLDNAGGMQRTGSAPNTTFGGFGSFNNGSEAVHKTPGAGVHGSISIDRYNLTAEWVTASEPFRVSDLSFNGKGAQPQAGQVELGVTFMSFKKPSSVGVGYQWSGDTLALNLAANRVNAVYNISLWKDTVESVEYRHDTDFSSRQFANGAAPKGSVNQPTVGTGAGADTVLIQIGVYF
jgi:hypothetical protein